MSDHRPLISKAELLALVPLTYVSIWRMIREGKFPRGIAIGNTTHWYQDEVQAWLDAQPRQDFAGPNIWEHSKKTREGIARSKHTKAEA